jgi:hypothetical protein
MDCQRAMGPWQLGHGKVPLRHLTQESCLTFNWATQERRGTVRNSSASP